MGQPQPVRVEESELTDVSCDVCHNVYYDAVAKVKRMSALNPKSGGVERFVVIRVLICRSCKKELKGITI